MCLKNVMKNNSLCFTCECFLVNVRDISVSFEVNQMMEEYMAFEILSN